MMVNESFIYGNFPDKLKTSKVIPLHKKGFTQDTNSCRPLSLLLISIQQNFGETDASENIQISRNTQHTLPISLAFVSSILLLMLLSKSLKKSNIYS